MVSDFGVVGNSPDVRLMGDAFKERQLTADNADHLTGSALHVLGCKVTEGDIAHVIELWTGIPASKVQDNELNKLAGFEDKLREKLIGQDSGTIC